MATRRAVNSDCAPACGCSVTKSIPVIRASICSSSYASASTPCVMRYDCRGWRSAKSDAARSFSFGLYFIVHDPSGYIPVSTE